jgi:hypothetical protein
VIETSYVLDWDDPMSSRSSTAARRSASEADWWLRGSDGIVGEPTLGFKEDHRMKRVTLFKVLVHDEDEALDFYTKKLGFEVAEDNKLGEYRWLLVVARQQGALSQSGHPEDRGTESACRSPGCGRAAVQHRDR